MSATVPPRLRRAQRGVATLVVVMVLFFIVSMVAAYTNRNLIFEQRTSANQYRSTQALEAAEAGVEWVLAMLNHQRIDATCRNGAQTDTSYRQRYLTTNPNTGELSPLPKADGTPRSQSCVYNGTDWNCDCPTTANPAPTAPGGSAVYPAFQVRLEAVPTLNRPGTIVIHAVGCTRLDAACLSFNGDGIDLEGRATVRVIAALTGNAVSPPAAAVLARGDITMTGAATVHNTAVDGSGITMHSGGSNSAAPPPTFPPTAPAPFVLHGAPGTPGALTIVANDPALALPAAGTFSTDDRMFASIFNMTPASFEQQPAIVYVPCPTGSCNAATVRSAMLLSPGRPVWVQGDLLVDSAGDIGSTAEPVLLVVNGNLGFSVGGVTIHGLAYLRTADWVTAGSGQLTGAAVAQGDISGSGTPTIVRDDDLLFRLRYGSGSFVRLPGSWRDFQ